MSKCVQIIIYNTSMLRHELKTDRHEQTFEHKNQFKKLRSLYGHMPQYTHEMNFSLNIFLWYVFS